MSSPHHDGMIIPAEDQRLWTGTLSGFLEHLPEPLELRSTKTSQSYVWLFGFAKKIRLWSARDRFLVVF